MKEIKQTKGFTLVNEENEELNYNLQVSITDTIIISISGQIYKDSNSTYVSYSEQENGNINKSVNGNAEIIKDAELILDRAVNYIKTTYFNVE